MKTKAFDCVAMKRRASQAIYERTRNMTPEEELAFWQEQSQQLHALQETLQRQQKKT